MGVWVIYVCICVAESPYCTLCKLTTIVIMHVCSIMSDSL